MRSNEETAAYLKGIVNNLPETPGCYQYLDESGTIIYVGKAKNLKRRVSSYFNKEQQTRKTRLLVARIRDIRYVVVKTEEDALLLENNLIKRYKPHYNVLLKDDKTYPSIAVTTEYLPRIFKTRQRGKRGAVYFGPYSHVPTMYALLDLCRELYQPRPCRTPFGGAPAPLGSPLRCGAIAPLGAALSLTLGSPRCGGLRRKTVTPKFFAAAVCKITHKEAKVRGGAVPWR